MLFRVAAVIAVVALGSGSAFAEPETKTLQVFRDIEKQVNRYTYFTIFDDVNVAIEEEGVVMLTGSVTMPFKKNEIAKRVAQVDGVTEVRNAIQVLPVSGLDNALRYRVARAIYGNSMFRRYGTRFSPPIHIVVDRGHVTLTMTLFEKTKFTHQFTDDLFLPFQKGGEFLPRFEEIFPTVARSHLFPS